MNKICQGQLLIEYLRRYGKYLPDERMLEVVDIDVLEDFREEMIRTCEHIKEEFIVKRGESDINDFYR